MEWGDKRTVLAEPPHRPEDAYMRASLPVQSQHRLPRSPSSNLKEAGLVLLYSNQADTDPNSL